MTRNYRKEILQKAQEITSPTPKPKRPSRKSEGVSYEEWEQRLSKVISNRFGLDMIDFPDWHSMDSYENDRSVMEGFADFKEEQGDELFDNAE